MEAARLAGARVTRTPLEQARPRTRSQILHQKAHLVAEQWSHACARIARILEGSGQGGAVTTEAATADAEMPKLAAEYLRLWKLYSWLRWCNADWNPFRGLSDRDASRKFMRMVMDICDRSTGRMGGWWVR